MRRLTPSAWCAAAALALAGCGSERKAGAVPPAAEFLLAAGDSMFWVKSSASGVAVRGSPIVLAHIDGRFYELYVADDDRSFPRALFVGQRLYRRDILSGDSIVIFADTAIPPLAARYGREHPELRPLRPDEPADDEPLVEASAEVELLDVHGPYVSVEYHLDIDDEGGQTHHTARAVVDARTGRRALLGKLFGANAAKTLQRAGERAFAEAIDSVLAARDDRARRAANTISDFTFDAGSFTLAAVGTKPAVAFFAPGGGDRAGGLALPLPPIETESPPWWIPITSQLPETADDGRVDVWRRPAYEVRVEYSVSGEKAAIVLATTDSAWDRGVIPAPARRIFWLDDPPLDGPTRHALRRAFDEAALYDEDARRALERRRPSRSLVIPVSAALQRTKPRRAAGTRRASVSRQE